MGSSRYLILMLLLIFIMNSCNIKFFVERDLIIQKETGIIFLFDNANYKNREFGEGDIFVIKDSLIPDFFISHKFASKPITKEAMLKAMFSNTTHSAHFINLIRDCKGTEKQTSIEIDSWPLEFDEPIDSYLKEKKIFLLPVEIQFVFSSVDREYPQINKSIILKHNSKSTKIEFMPKDYDIIDMKVIQYDW